MLVFHLAIISNNHFNLLCLMKTSYASLGKVLLFFLSLVGIFIACESINPLEGLEVTVQTNVYQSPIAIQFMDANSAATKLPEGVTVSIAGAGKELVLSDLGDKNYVVSGNILTLVLAENANPSTLNPVVFTVTATAPGYVTTSQTFSITDATTPQAFTMNLTNVATPPVGTGAKTEELSLTAGQVLTIPATTEKSETATIKIEPGTQVKDVNGNVINASTVKAQVIQYGTTMEEALNSFPGGFTPNNVTVKSGAVTSGAFVTAGFVAVDMEAGGKKVKSFSKPIEVSVGLNEELMNPETNTTVKEGDIIPTWSYDSETDKWTEEGEAVVTKDNNGKLVATFKAAHLSYWNCDWFYSLNVSRYCYNYFSLTVSSNITTGYFNNYDYYAMMYLIYPNGTKVYRGRFSYFNVINGAINRFGGGSPAGNYRMQFEVYSYRTGAKLGSTAVFNPCSVTQVPITINLPNPPVYVPVDIDFTAKCLSKNVTVKPSVWIYFYEKMPNSLWWNRRSYVYLQNGKGTVTLLDGAEYSIYTYYAGNYYWNRGIFGKNKTGTLSGNTGGVLSGQTIYDAATGRVKLTAKYDLTTCR